MADHPFEDEAARLFAVAPAFGDGEVFARAVEARLENFVVLRRRVLGAVAAVAGIGSGVMLIRSTVFADIGQRIAGLQVGEQLAQVPSNVWTLFAVALALGGWLYGRSSLAR